MGLLHGRVTPDLFDEEVVRDPVVLEHIDKIKVFAEPEFESAFPKVQRCHVAIDTTDGRSFEKQIDWPKGDPRDPLSDQEIRAKFDALAVNVSDQRREQIWAAAADLPDCAVIAEFTAICSRDQ
jgi:2-methylcitrate dehydratase